MDLLVLTAWLALLHRCYGAENLNGNDLEAEKRGKSRNRASSSMSDQERLYEDLLGRKSGYSKQIIPLPNQNRKLTVQFGIAVPEVINLDEKNGQFQARVWLRMTWKNYKLTWNPTDYNGLELLHVPVKNIWLPDVVIYNGYKIDLDTDKNAVLYPDGNILWVAPMTFYSTCLHEFRTDAWTCPLRFGSWSYDSSKLDIVPIDGQHDIDLSDYISNLRWSLLESSGERTVRKYECCAETYPSMEYKMVFRSKIGPSFIGRRKRSLENNEF